MTDTLPHEYGIPPFIRPSGQLRYDLSGLLGIDFDYYYPVDVALVTLHSTRQSSASFQALN